MQRGLNHYSFIIFPRGVGDKYSISDQSVWASGTVRSWFPDRIEMNEAMPPVGANISQSPVSRKVFITRDDVVGMELVWKITHQKK